VLNKHQILLWDVKRAVTPVPLVKETRQNKVTA
jgi:hypothetical protein